MTDDQLSAGNNTYIFDPESITEMARLIQLDQFTTRAAGGPLGEQGASATFQHILDIACGPGGWVLDTAFAHPQAEVAGIDISQIMIDYANARARSQGLHNASFGVMDVRQSLDFSDHSFDLVNARFLVGVLSRSEWPLLLQECFRITQPGGVLRLTESDNGGLTNSPAFEQLSEMLTRAMQRAGYGFSPDGRTLGMTPVLEHLLRAAGYKDVHSVGHAINFSAGTEAWLDFYRNSEIGSKAAQPLMIHTGLATQDELDQLHQQMLTEMNADTFCGVWFFLTTWGTRP